jgi:NDP-sugar pyrophosphorylase family protein
MKGMVLAAGFGTRFRPATYELPKPLVPLCNRPLIDYAIDNLLAAGVTELVVNLHHLGEMLRQHLRHEYAGRCSIHFSHEEEILGTGGGVRRVRSLLAGTESFFLVNGDTVHFPPLAQLEKVRREEGALAALVLRHPPEGDRFTAVFYERNRVTGIGEGHGQALMFSGAHAVSSLILDRLPDREFSGIVEDVYIPVLREGDAILAGMVHDGPWFDIGTPLRYLRASHAVRQAMLAGELPLPDGSRTDPARASIVHRTARVDEGSEVVAGEESVISSGAAVDRSVIWRRCAIAAGAAVRDAVLCDGVQLPSGARVENALVSPRREGVSYDGKITLLQEFAAVAIDPSRPVILELD